MLLVLGQVRGVNCLSTFFVDPVSPSRSPPPGLCLAFQVIVFLRVSLGLLSLIEGGGFYSVRLAASTRLSTFFVDPASPSRPSGTLPGLAQVIVILRDSLSGVAVEGGCL